MWYVEYQNSEGKRVKKNFGPDQISAQVFFSSSILHAWLASVNRELPLLKHMYSKGVEWGRVKETPTKKVKLLKGEIRRVRFLLSAEIQKLISNCADHLKPIVTLELCTGMRKGELLGLGGIR